MPDALPPTGTFSSACFAVEAHVPCRHYRPDIDGLRAIAMLMVVGFHAFPKWFTGGYIGVDIFFVISGYLISLILFDGLRSNHLNLIEFYSRRIKRIFPALLLVLAVSYIVGWFELLPNEFRFLSKHIMGGGSFSTNFMLWMDSGYFDADSIDKPLLHLWSLAVEEQFYIFWPIVLILANKWRLNLLSLAVVIGVVSFGVNLHDAPTNQIAAFYSPLSRAWELMLGAVFAYFIHYAPNAFANAKRQFKISLDRLIFDHSANHFQFEPEGLLSLFGVAFIIAGLCAVSKETHYPGWYGLLPTVGALLIIAAGPHAWFNRKILSYSALVKIGLISYPLYLWHWSLLSYAHILYAHLLGASTPPYAISAGLVAASFVLAWGTYIVVEKPIRFGNPSRQKVLVLIGLMIGISGAALYCYLNKGLENRFTGPIKDYLLFDFDQLKAYRAGTCHLYADQNDSAFAACKSPFDAKKPTLLLWGDSYAAHLYAGYLANFGKQYNIVQRTASLCPPIVGVEVVRNPNCQDINDATLEYARQFKPDKVVLSAVWASAYWPKLYVTIRELQRNGITNIDVIGSMPLWNDALPRLVFLKYKSDVGHQIPTRMNFGLDRTVFTLDPRLKAIAVKLKVRFIQPENILCDDSGCLTRVGDTADTMTAWDRGHLTTAGSEYLVEHFPKN